MDTFARYAFDIVTKSFVIIFLFTLLYLMARKLSAAARHMIVVAAAMTLLALPLFCIPAASPLRSEEAVSVPQPGTKVSSGSNNAETLSPVQPVTKTVNNVPLVVTHYEAPAIVDSAFYVALLLLWIIAAAVMLLRIAFGFIYLRHKIKKCGFIHMSVGRLNLNIPGGIRLMISQSDDIPASPIVYGLRCPRILLPSDAAEWDESRLRIVLLHELAHIKRRDILWIIVIEIVQALYCCNPLIWWLAYRSRIDCEEAVDNVVLTHGIEQDRYAQCLVDIAAGIRKSILPASATVAIVERTQIAYRIQTILSKGINRSGVERTFIGTLLIAALAGIGMMGCFRVNDNARDTTYHAYQNLPGGVRVELYGVSLNPSVGKQWWTPDGKHLVSAPYKALTAYSYPQDKAREVALLVTNAPNNMTWTVEFKNATGYAGGSHPSGGNFVDNKSLLAYSVSYSNTNPKVDDISFGLSYGAWKVEKTLSPGSYYEEYNNNAYDKDPLAPSKISKSREVKRLINPLIASDTKTTIPVMLEDNYGEERLAVVGRDHKVYLPSQTDSSGSLRSYTYDLPVSQVKELQIQSRPYHWVLFKNVRLNPEVK